MDICMKVQRELCSEECGWHVPGAWPRVPHRVCEGVPFLALDKQLRSLDSDIDLKMHCQNILCIDLLTSSD